MYCITRYRSKEIADRLCESPDKLQVNYKYIN